MIDTVVYKPNRVLEKQKLVQGMHAPVYRRLPRSNLYLNSYFGLWAIGLGSTIYGAYTLVFDKPAGPE
ncbi:hypothetical protein CONPUDRAFT_168797 [Coniophora puteana RWD-64-598 SS2]|uniref:Uncharacterized protein n=1 Tax=Coniophora puteana (strain RWD-64-598) TaxID=741705 RepID=A0A5M3MAD1_CONPW|nr:uncharacterized protein CONPUDRAFT_168797 [Coniophora puteana RWD-64-598 SS2]EIW76218.1 hypothetical protein CONPUDRAFT_168797 [Coniophora puteana RWD-64-598 SS2]